MFGPLSSWKVASCSGVKGAGSADMAAGVFEGKRWGEDFREILSRKWATENIGNNIPLQIAVTFEAEHSQYLRRKHTSGEQ
jgi:hypothetical protein